MLSALPFWLRRVNKHRKAQILPYHDDLNPDTRKLVTCNSLRTSAISLLCNGKLDSLALWQRDPWLLGTNDKDVVLSGSE